MPVVPGWIRGSDGGVRGHDRVMDGYFLNPACGIPVPAMTRFSLSIRDRYRAGLPELSPCARFKGSLVCDHSPFFHSPGMSPHLSIYTPLHPECKKKKQSRNMSFRADSSFPFSPILLSFMFMVVVFPYVPKHQDHSRKPLKGGSKKWQRKDCRKRSRTS